MAQTDFEQNKYVIVKNAISPETASIFAQYTLFKAENDFKNDTPGMVPDTHSVYGDPLMESLLSQLTPKVEEATGLSLYPTYSFYRVYKPGDELHKHIDRAACEISLSINLGYEYWTEDETYTWNLWADGKEMVLEPGDMVIYRGLEVEHWREPFNVENGWQSQAFLHYVDVDGPFAFCKYDARPGLGFSDWTRNQTTLDLAESLKQEFLEELTDRL